MIARLRPLVHNMVLPEKLTPGEVVMLNGIPHTITSAREEREPFTHKPAIRLWTDREESHFWLVLTCATCGLRMAAPWSMKMEDTEWIEVRYKGAYYWLCPEHGGPVVEVVVP